MIYIELQMDYKVEYISTDYNWINILLEQKKYSYFKNKIDIPLKFKL